MVENHDTGSYLHLLPTEVLIYIFSFLTAKELTKCREVCTRLKSVIDGLQKSEFLWYRYCTNDFQSVYQIAKQNSKPGLNWYKIYKSLSLWPKLTEAREVRDEFAFASNTLEEILDIKVLRNGIIGVHKKSSVVYYDIATLEVCKHPLPGPFLRYTENDRFILILGYQFHLHVIRKVLLNQDDKHKIVIDNVKSFIFADNTVHYVTVHEEIFILKLNSPNLTSEFIKTSPENVMCVAYKNAKLYLLTYERNVYSVNEKELVFCCSLESAKNLLHVLKEYNFLENLDWRIYFQWMYILNHTIPTGPLRDTIVIKVYGETIFVGTDWGVLRIYHSPYNNGELDLYSAIPVKQYNFMEREDCPVLSDHCPIIQIEVMEMEDGHKVLAAMPKKIAILDFVHSSKRNSSAAMLPYRDMERIKVLRINECVQK